MLWLGANIIYYGTRSIEVEAADKVKLFIFDLLVYWYVRDMARAPTNKIDEDTSWLLVVTTTKVAITIRPTPS